MINTFYKEFKIRDYMDDDILKEIASSKVIDCSLGTNDFIDVKLIKEYILKSNYELNKYPILEYELLKDELIKYWKKYINYSLKKENIAFGSGVMGILRNLSEILFNQNARVLGSSPQFPRFISEVELKRAMYDYYCMDIKNNCKFEVEDFINKIDKDYDVIHIENPNNPTGQIIDIGDIEKIVIEANKHNSIVLVDEAYGDYMDSKNSAITLIGKYDNVTVLRSASKYYGLPNHRVGYLVANEENIFKHRVILFIEDICVDIKYKRQGIGKMLYSEIVKYAKQNKIDSIELVVWSFNTDAIKFYEELGMAPKNIRYEYKIKN